MGLTTFFLLIFLIALPTFQRNVDFVKDDDPLLDIRDFENEIVADFPSKAEPKASPVVVPPTTQPEERTEDNPVIPAATPPPPAPPHNFTKEQRLLLEKIKIAGEEGSLPESVWSSIETYDGDTCYTQDCLDSALEIMSSTDFSVDPCEPGRWLDFVCTRRVEGLDYLSQIDQLEIEVNQQTMSLLDIQDSSSEEDVVEAREYESDFLFQEARSYYHQCIQKERNDYKDVHYALELFKSYHDGVGWPMVTHQIPPKNFSWSQMVADGNRLERTNYSPLLLQVSVTKDNPNIELNIGRTSFRYDVDSISDYETMATRMQSEGELEEPVNISQITTTMEYMSELTSKVVSLLPENVRNVTYSNFTLPALQAATDDYFLEHSLPWNSFNWTGFFSRALSGTGIRFSESSGPNISLPFLPVMELISFVEGEMRSNETEAEGRTAIVNALFMNVIPMLLHESTVLMDDLNTFRCDEESGTREAICLQRTKTLFGYSLGKTYLKAYYRDGEVTPRILEIMENVKTGFIKSVQARSWMSNQTKEFLVDKIRSMKVYVAQPPWLKEPGKLEEFYKGLRMSTSSKVPYAKNFVTTNLWSVAKKRGWAHRLSQMENEKELFIYDYDWNNYLAQVNAYYTLSNEIQVDAGILQSPLFGANRPGFMNYGGVGSFLSHEVGHSFDTDGRMHDKHGNEGEFWDEASVQMYQKIVNETVAYYASIPLHITPSFVSHLNAEQTMDEDISDMLGVHSAYFAYEEYLGGLEREGKRELVLPGLKEYSPQKLFYMKYANMWCENVDVQSQVNQIHDDSHSPGNRRATLPLMKSAEFKKTFGCRREEADNEL